MQSILEGTAAERIKRAIRSKTRPASEQLRLEVGSLVDFWRQPMTRDDSGWMGPGVVVHVEHDSGNIHVKFQGHVYSCSSRHVRNALTFFLV